MPLRPDFSQHQPDPRFDRYRDRVGRLFRGDDEVGLVLVLVEPYAQGRSGRLWWTRWDRTGDILWLWTIVDGRFSDDLVPDDVSDEELRRLDQGLFPYYADDLRVVWLNRNDSARLRSLEFAP